MTKLNEEWGKCIAELLAKHKLTLRGARLRTGGAVSHTYIKDWIDGVVPTRDVAISFLSHFPKEEAIRCLEIAGYSIPDEWSRPEDLIRRYVIACRGKMDRATMLKRIQEILDEEANEPKDADPES